MNHADRGGVAWVMLGLIALLPLLFADPRLPLPEMQYTLAGFGYGAIRAGLGVTLFSGMVGFLTPMLVDRWSGGDPDRAGRAYAVNVVGSILGPLVAGFAVLPWAGERWGLCVVALPLFVIGLRMNRKPLYVACVAASVLLAAFTKDYGTKFPHRIELRDYAATVIATGEGMDKRILVNGTGMTVLTPITKVMAHLPLSMLGRPAGKRAGDLFRHGDYVPLGDVVGNSHHRGGIDSERAEGLRILSSGWTGAAGIAAGAYGDRRWAAVSGALARNLRFDRGGSAAAGERAHFEPALLAGILRHHQAAS